MTPWRYRDSGTTASSTSADAWIYTSSTASQYWVGRTCIKPRTILVEEPGHWTDEDGLAFVRLVNEETRTGWRVILRIKGDVLITDPDVETRTMGDFIILLKSRASKNDGALIGMFLDEHPLTAGPQ